jgi:hypothetical protein
VDEFSTQDTYLEQIYLLLQKPMVDFKYTICKYKLVHKEMRTIQRKYTDDQVIIAKYED